MIKKNKILIFEIILFLSVKILIYYLNYKYYGVTYNGDYIQMIMTLGIVLSLFRWKRKIKDNREKEYKFKAINLIVVILTIITFYFTKPNITYYDAKNILMDNNYSNVKELEVNSIITNKFKLNGLRANAYIYLGNKDKENLYLLVSCETGDIVEEQMGSEIEVFLE